MFTTLALVGMLILPLNCFPWVLNGVLEAYVSLERIQRFVRLPNQDLQAYYSLGRLSSSRDGFVTCTYRIVWGNESGNAYGVVQKQLCLNPFPVG